VLGGYTDGFAAIDDVTPLRRKLEKKADHYGELDRPYAITALYAGDFADEEDIANALLGTAAIQFETVTMRSHGVRLPDGQIGRAHV
jgi:hypothetical protein